MAPIVYSIPASPPSRAVLLTAAAVGIELDVHNLNLLEGEHKKEAFVKINPQHTVPTLDDKGFVIWDSHAIAGYLVDKYAKDDSLYPKDHQIRATINQRLHFDTGVLFTSLKDIVRPIFYEGVPEIPAEKLETLGEAYEFLDKFLEGKKWLVGDSYTIADISCVSSVSSLTVILPIDKYANVAAWLKRCEENLPGYAKFNAPGCADFHKLFLSKAKKQ